MAVYILKVINMSSAVRQHYMQWNVLGYVVMFYCSVLRSNHSQLYSRWYNRWEFISIQLYHYCIFVYWTYAIFYSLKGIQDSMTLPTHITKYINICYSRVFGPIFCSHNQCQALYDVMSICYSMIQRCNFV